MKHPRGRRPDVTQLLLFAQLGISKGFYVTDGGIFCFFPCVFNKRLTNISPKSNCSSAAFWEITVVYPMCCAAVLALLS